MTLNDLKIGMQVTDVMYPDEVGTVETNDGVSAFVNFPDNPHTYNQYDVCYLRPYEDSNATNKEQ